MSKDIIYREDAIKTMEQRYKDILRTFKRKVKVGEKAIVLDMIGCVKNLPSADRPQGEWIQTSNDWIDGTCGARYYPIHCSICNYSTYDDDATNYCPNCGCRMKGADDE
jgi:rubrerythrin